MQRQMELAQERAKRLAQEAAEGMDSMSHMPLPEGPADLDFEGWMSSQVSVPSTFWTAVGEMATEVGLRSVPDWVELTSAE